MPELPEVETVRKGLEKRLKGFCVKKVEVLSQRTIASEGGSEEFISSIKGLIIGKWERRGKYLIAKLLTENSSGENINSGSLVIHLRMTGYFQWHKKSNAACKHTRVRLWNSQGAEIRFVDIRNFGQVWLIPKHKNPREVIRGLRTLGPEPFSKEFNPIYLKRSLKGKSRSIKSALLDQSLVAGIGNIYADESLFDAGIIPIKQSGKLKDSEINRLCKSIVKVIRISIGKGGTTFSDFRDLEGLNGNYGGEAWVYRRDTKPCRKCGETIYKEKISGRSSHWCPRCQN
ncbi:MULTISPECIES: DNA-formamidopyrimidine glycosylase [Prochlorococcus]|uniref:DNA-formamidopyrimidine glycosylase n=1 Tax=Prochlorococcus TaxID=1218 RepID=UPI000533BA7C|nr:MULTISPECIES: DNA-formamidopyrimidine glycosylase [Prochlorococcus]KGG13025.1 Formamidopyrimidine-DNA glycosylase [Prochlorococcus sp. MIT 0601]